MGSNLNRYIAVAYKLYTVDNGESTLVEEATDKEPFQFISGYGITLDAFEKEIAGLEKGVLLINQRGEKQAYPHRCGRWPRRKPTPHAAG